MRIGKIEVRRRVWVASAAVLAATVAWWAWSRARPPLAGAPKPATSSFVQLASAGTGPGDEILREQAELLDPTPLFFPTEWNYGQRPLRESLQRQPGQVFPGFGARLTFSEQSLKPYGAGLAVAPSTLADVLAQGNESPLAGFGQVDTTRPPLEERDAFVEVRKVGEDKFVLEQPLTGLVVPKPDFAPTEFLVVVDAAGVIGEPLLMGESGGADVDGFFRAYLVDSFRIGGRLDPGNYRVIIGP